VRPTPFGAALAAAASVSLAFLLIPIVAIFAELSFGELVDGITSDVALEASSSGRRPPTCSRPGAFAGGRCS
jgi:hypothetical protein